MEEFEVMEEEEKATQEEEEEDKLCGAAGWVEEESVV